MIGAFKSLIFIQLHVNFTNYAFNIIASREHRFDSHRLSKTAVSKLRVFLPKIVDYIVSIWGE